MRISENGAVGSEWIGVIGALGGVVVTGAIGLATAVLNHRWTTAAQAEEREEARLDSNATKRLEAYSRYLAASDVVDSIMIATFSSDEWRAAHQGVDSYQQALELRAKDPKPYDEYDSALGSAQLLAGAAVGEALERFDAAFVASCMALVADPGASSEGKNEAGRALREAMRREVQRGV
jgi:hypothetical protein